MFAETEYVAVDEPKDDLARFNCYLDDIFGAFMEREAEKGAAAIPLALHIVGRPHDPNGRESFPRDDILAIPKFLAEAKPSERKVILGWTVDTRKLSVALPQDKFRAWTGSVDDILRRHKSPIPTKESETLMGRLNHASYVIPYARHFTGRLARWSGFLAAFVGLLVEHGAGRKWSSADVMLSQGDSKSAAGWLAKSTFDDAVRRLLHHERHRPLYAVVPGQEEERGRRFVQGLRPERRGGHKTNSQQLLTICTSALQDHPLAANDHFANWRLAASAAQNAALAGSTRAKRDGSWRRYECFLGRIGQLLEPFLGRLGRTQKVEVFASFAAALWGERLGARQREGPRHGRKSGNIRTTLDGVAQTFRLHKFESPIHNAAGRLEPILALQLKGYADEDLDPRPQPGSGQESTSNADDSTRRSHRTTGSDSLLLRDEVLRVF